MDICAKCKKEIGPHGYILFGTQEGKRGYWNICPPCYDEIRRIHPISRKAKRNER